MAELSLTDLQKIASLDSDIRDYATDTSERVSDIETSLGNISNKVNRIAGLFGTTLAVGTFAGISKALWDMDKSTTKLAIRAGRGKEYAKELKSSINDLQKGLGASFNEASQLVSSLAKKNYVGNIHEAAMAAYMFADATGLSIDETSELTDNLSKIVGLSEKSMASLYYGIVKVQQANGISENGMSALANRINEAATNMKAFGRTDAQIKEMAVSTAKLISSMEKVGVSAQTSLRWVEQLTDPERIEENIGLYSQLGVSMEEALSGGNIADQLLDGMKEFGQKVQAMGPIAGAAYAKSFGISYKEAIKAAKAEDINVNTETTEDKSLEALQDVAKQTHSLTDNMQRAFQKANGFIMGLGPVIMTVAAIVFQVLKRAKKDASETTASISTEIEKTVDKVKGKLNTTKNDVKGYVGSLFDVSAMKEAENEVDKAVKNFQLGMHGTVPVISVIQDGVSEVGRSVNRIFDFAKKKNGEKYTSEFYNNSLKASKAYFQNIQDSYKDQWESTVSEIQVLKEQKNNLKEGTLEYKRMEKVIEMMTERAKGYARQMTEGTKEALKPEREKVELIEKEIKEQGALIEKLNAERELASAINKDSNTKYSKEQLQKAEYELALANKQLAALEKKKESAKAASDAIKEEYALAEKTNISNQKAMEYMAKHPLLGKMGQMLRALGTRKDANGIESRPETKSQAVGNILIKGLTAAVNAPIKALGAGIKALGPMLKSLGPIGAGMLGLRIVMQLLHKPIERIRQKFEEKIQPIMDKLDEQLGPAFSTIADAVLKLAVKLLPPLLFVSGLLVSGIGHLINAFKWLPGVGQNINEIGDSLVDAGKSMRAVRKSIDANTQSNTSKGQAGPGNIDVANNGSLVVTDATLANTASTPSASSSDSVQRNTAINNNKYVEKRQQVLEDMLNTQKESNSYQKNSEIINKQNSEYMKNISEKMDKMKGVKQSVFSLSIYG